MLLIRFDFGRFGLRFGRFGRFRRRRHHFRGRSEMILCYYRCDIYNKLSHILFPIIVLHFIDLFLLAPQAPNPPFINSQPTP